MRPYENKREKLTACTSATAATMAAAASTLSRGGKFATLPSGAFDSHCEWAVYVVSTNVELGK